MESPRLDSLLADAAQQRPNHPAVIAPATGEVTYHELNEVAQALSRHLQAAGVKHNDRVGICLPKSIGSVASIFACLACRACYVPVDPGAPAQRSAFIFNDCAVSAMLVHRPLLEALQLRLQELGMEIDACQGISTDVRLGVDLVLLVPASVPSTVPPTDADLAYILYTSGSTGKPKGVMHSHASAFSFIDWCSQALQPREDDRFSSHAPLHFDLSIFDLFVSIKHKATLVLISEADGKQPLVLADLIEAQKISVWYSTPSILRLLLEYGKLETRDYSALRLILYAGEVFPLKHLRALQALLPTPQYFNLYGPTETNVCTFRPVPNPLPDDEYLPQRIGWVCSGDRARVVDENGQTVPPGEEGELWIAGGSVHLGYWNLPEQNARAFAFDAEGTRWYRTGDLVIDQGGGDFLFLGRRDRMVKRRGFRVELGEIETVLYSHPFISEAAVVALPDPESGVQLRAFIQWRGDSAPSVLELKRFASQNLVSYMVPDRFVFLDALPKTSTDKVDYQQLKAHS